MRRRCSRCSIGCRSFRRCRTTRSRRFRRSVRSAKSTATGSSARRATACLISRPCRTGCCNGASARCRASSTSSAGAARPRHTSSQIDFNKLIAYGLTLPQLLQALNNSNINVGGSTVNIGPQAAVVRGVGLIRSLEDSRNTMLTQSNGIPVLVSDVATVTVGQKPRLGIAGNDADDDIVLSGRVDGLLRVGRRARNEFVVEPLVPEITLFVGDPFLQPAMRLNTCHVRNLQYETALGENSQTPHPTPNNLLEVSKVRACATDAATIKMVVSTSHETGLTWWQRLVVWWRRGPPPPQSTLPEYCAALMTVCVTPAKRRNANDPPCED